MKNSQQKDDEKKILCSLAEIMKAAKLCKLGKALHEVDKVEGANLYTELIKTPGVFKSFVSEFSSVNEIGFILCVFTTHVGLCFKEHIYEVEKSLYV